MGLYLLRPVVEQDSDELKGKVFEVKVRRREQLQERVERCGRCEEDVCVSKT